MWMDIAQDGDQDPRHSEDEDTVYDRTNPFSSSQISKNPFEQGNETEAGTSHATMRMPMLEDQDTRCGLCAWRPHYMQKFSNKTLFSVIFTIVGVVQSSIWSYYTANISTLEKRFRMDSVTSGVLLFANELAQVLVAVLFTYFNFRRHRAKLLTLGVALTSFSCFLMASPHFFMGSGDVPLSLIKRSPATFPQTYEPLPDGQPHNLNQPEWQPLVQVKQFTGSSADIEVATTSSLSTASTNYSKTDDGTTDTLSMNITNEAANNYTQKVTEISLSSVSLSSLSSSVVNTASNLSKSSISLSSATTPAPGTTSPMGDIRSVPGKENIGTTPTKIYHSLINDEMRSVWPTCQRDIEHISTSSHNETTCDDMPLFERKLAFGFIFTANFIFGIASMFYLMSGGPFSEDSTIFPNEIPRIFGITMSIRLMGSFFGYLFAWSCLTEFINPLETPIQIDNRWLGAYWLGWLCLAVFMALFSLMFSLFPRQSPREFLKKRSLTHDTGLSMLLIPSIVPFFGGAEVKTANTFPSILNVPGVSQAFFRNRVYLLLTTSTLAHVFVSVGHLTFLPKYMEFMFRLRANDAAALTGISSVPFQVAGLMLSGAFIARYLPSPKELSHWSCVVSALQIVIFMVISFLGCDTSRVDVSFLHSSDSANAGGSNNSLHCSADCECGRGSPIPACDLYSGVTYYSPCHAGCEDVLNQTGIFSQCSCLASGNVTLVEGFCPGDGCANGLIAFLVFICLGQFLRGSAVVGRMLLSYKSLQADQRTAVIGFTMLIASLVAVIPSPIIFGSLFESACLVRETHSCASKGKVTVGVSMDNCWLYNDSSLRFTYNLGAAAFLVVALAIDILAWKKKDVHNLRIYDGELRQLTSHHNGESNNNRFSTVPLS